MKRKIYEDLLKSYTQDFKIANLFDIVNIIFSNLNLGFNCQNELLNNYALLATDITSIEDAKKASESESTKTESTSEENTDTENTSTDEQSTNAEEQNTESVSTETSSTESTTNETETNKKTAKLYVNDTTYDVSKIEKGKITLKIGSSSTNTTSINNNISKAAEIAMLENAGKLPADYEIDTNRYEYSSITQKEIIYFAVAMLAVLLIILIVYCVIYKKSGILASISFVGFISLFSLLIRYTNVAISIDGISAIIIVMIINLIINKEILSKTKRMNLVDEAVKSTYKNVYLKLIPVGILTIVFCLAKWESLSSFGMIMFWGLILTAIYNVVITRTLLKLKEKIAMLLVQIDREWDLKIKEIKRKLDDSEERRHKLIEIYNERDSLKEHIKHDAKKTMNDYFKHWRGITCSDIYYRLFEDDQIFEIVTANRIPKGLAEYIKNDVLRNKENGIIDEDDLPILFYIHMILEGIDEKNKFKHIVVDEAQDYSPFQIYLINNMSKGNSLTLVGDLAQGIYHYKGIRKWEDITEGVFDGKATFISLSQSYRSTVEIIEFANYALKAQGLNIKSAKPVLRHGDKPQIIKSVSRRESVELIDEIVKRLNSKGKHSIAIITKTFNEAKILDKELKKYTNLEYTLIKGNEKDSPNTDIVLIPTYLTKGLEFDGTIIYNPTEKNYPDNILNQRLLYVALTRALHNEYIITEEELSKNIVRS